MRHAHTLANAFVLALLVPLLSGCLGDKPTIGLLVPDDSLSSARAVDVEAFTDRVRATCQECTVTVYDAEGDPAQQKSQVRQALAESANVLVVVPIEPDEMESVVTDDVPMVSVGSLVAGTQGYVGLEDDSDVDTSSDSSRESDLEAARDLVLGKRSSMTYVPTIEMSEQAADVSVALLADEPLADGEQVEGVQSWLYPAQKVTLDTLTTVLVGGGVFTIDELCEGRTAKRCKQIGLR